VPGCETEECLQGWLRLSCLVHELLTESSSRRDPCPHHVLETLVRTSLSYHSIQFTGLRFVVTGEVRMFPCGGRTPILLGHRLADITLQYAFSSGTAFTSAFMFSRMLFWSAALFRFAPAICNLYRDSVTLSLD